MAIALRRCDQKSGTRGVNLQRHNSKIRQNGKMTGKKNHNVSKTAFLQNFGPLLFARTDSVALGQLNCFRDHAVIPADMLILHKDILYQYQVMSPSACDQDHWFFG